MRRSCDSTKSEMPMPRHRIAMTQRTRRTIASKRARSTCCSRALLCEATLHSHVLSRIRTSRLRMDTRKRLHVQYEYAHVFDTVLREAYPLCGDVTWRDCVSPAQFILFVLRVGFRALCFRFRARPAQNCPKLPKTAQNYFYKYILLKNTCFN